MIRVGRYYPSEKVLDMLIGTLSELQGSSDLPPEDARRLQQFALRLIAEYSAVKEVPIRPPSKPYRPIFRSPANSM